MPSSVFRAANRVVVAVPLVIVRHGPAAARFQLQARLCSIQGLNLALLIDAQHERLVRWIEVQADDVDQFGNKLRIVADLKRRYTMRLQVMIFPNATHGGFADRLCLGHHAGAPVRRVRRFARQCGLHDRRNLLFRNGRDAARSGSILLQARCSKSQEAVAPQLHGGPRETKAGGDFLALDAVGCEQDNPRTLHKPLRLGSGSRPSLQSGPLLVGKRYGGRPSAHDGHDMRGPAISKVIYDALH